MKPQEAFGFAIGAMAAYVATAFVSAIPLLRFYPVSGVWSFAELADEPSITWFGRLLLAALAGGAGALVARTFVRRPPWRVVALLAVLAILALAFHERQWFAR